MESDTRLKFLAFLPAINAAPFYDFLNQAGDFLLQLLLLILGATGSPFSYVLFVYILPGLLVYFTLLDFIYLMGFFRKTTAMIIAGIFALFGARFGVYSQVVTLIQTFLGSSATGSGLWLPILTFVFILMAFWWMVGHFLWGIRFNTAIYKETQTVKAAIDTLDKIGTHLEKMGSRK